MIAAFSFVNVMPKEANQFDVVIIGGALVVVSGAVPASAAVKKMSQSAASYQPKPKGAALCDACALFQKPAACQTVAGVISPQGWCILFAAK